MRIEEKGATPLAAELAQIAALGAGGSLEGELARLHVMGVDAFFYYTREDPTSADVRKRYVEHIEEMLTSAFACSTPWRPISPRAS